MSVLVLGSNSFSGSHFCRHLLEGGFKVIGVSRNQNEPAHCFNAASWSKNYSQKFSYYSINILIDKDLIKLKQLLIKEDITHVINFAAQGMVAESWQTPADWYQTNLVAQVRVLDLLIKHNGLKKYVHVSTPEVYGSTPDWITENMIFAPSTPYAVSRAAFDLHLKACVDAYDFPAVWTRSANVYGAGQQLYRIIPRAFLSAITGKPMGLHGGGISERSFIDISDVCSATMALLHSGNPGDTYHLSTNRLISIKELVRVIFDLCGANFDEIVEIGEERLGKDSAYKLSSEKVRSELSWSDGVSLENGLDEVYQWMEGNLHLFMEMEWSYRHKK